MKSLTFFFTLIWLLFPVASFSQQSTGMSKVGNGRMSYLGFIRIYDAKLFTGPTATRSTILDHDVSRCLVIQYHVSFTAEELAAGAEEILRKQHDVKVIQGQQHNIDRLHRAYEDVREGDTYSLCYFSQEQVTTLTRNDAVVASIDSPDLASLYFGIWLGAKNTIDVSLKTALLRNLPE